jgi:hypothetical protein
MIGVGNNVAGKWFDLSLGYGRILMLCHLGGFKNHWNPLKCFSETWALHTLNGAVVIVTDCNLQDGWIDSRIVFEFFSLTCMRVEDNVLEKKMFKL